MDKSLKIKVVGARAVDFTNDQGQRFQSTKVFCISSSSNDNVIGNECLELRLPYETINKFKGKNFPLDATLIIGDFNLSKCTFKCLDIIL